MKTLVDSFYPSGSTNQGIGLAHAWMSLVGGGPYPTPPAEEPNYKYSEDHHPDERRPEHREPLVRYRRLEQQRRRQDRRPAEA